MAALDECVLKLNYLSLLGKDVIGANPAKLKSALGPDADAFFALRDAESNFNGEISDVDEDERSFRLRVTEEVGESLRHICRLLRDSPDLLDKLRTLQTKTAGGAARNPPLKVLLSVFDELRDLTYQRLVTSVEEEKSQKDFLTEITKKERKVSLEARALAQQLVETRQQREREASQRRAVLTKLKDELRDIQTQTATEAKLLEQETYLREAADMKSFQTEQVTLQDELQGLNAVLEDKTVQNKKKELVLRKKKLRIEKELENWILKYDQEMEEKETELEQLRSDYEREQKELQEVEEGYERLLREREAMLAENRRIEALALREMDTHKRQNDAATVIQHAWRGYLKRKKALTASKKKPSGKAALNEGVQSMQVVPNA